MRGIFGIAAFAAAVLAGPAGAQLHGGTPLEQAAAAYGSCVYDRARAAERAGALADAAIEVGFSRCKSQRKRALKEVRSRIIAAGLPADSAKSSAESMIASGDRGMVETLKQEFAARRGTAPGMPK